MSRDPGRFLASPRFLYSPRVNRGPRIDTTIYVAPFSFPNLTNESYLWIDATWNVVFVRFSFILLLLAESRPLVNRLNNLNKWKISLSSSRSTGCPRKTIFCSKLIDEFNAFNRRDGHGRRISNSRFTSSETFKRLFVSFIILTNLNRVDAWMEPVSRYRG